MFIAHAPVGYILGTKLVDRYKRLPVSAAVVILTCVLGALAPDFDMFYFYLVDNRQTHHHKYFTHWPLLWLVLSIVSILWHRWGRNTKASFVALLFSLSGLIHMPMDTVVGDIWWFAPFVYQPYAFFSVPATYKPWWLNFVLHWSFALELVFLAWAILIYRRRSNRLFDSGAQGSQST